jgi:indolepyruvate ferredoxin oxidoreductase beta subunit
MKKIDFVLAGVGGQGIMVASDVLAHVGLEQGYDVKKSEVHGMAQRGGSVVSHVRWADRVCSPLVGRGEADHLVAFEKLEALRYLGFLRAGGTVIVNDYAIPPVSVAIGKDSYPDDVTVDRILTEAGPDHYLVPGFEMARELGNVRTSNVVLLGALSTLLDVPVAAWEKVISNRVPKRYVDLNLKAFELGRGLVAGSSNTPRAHRSTAE